MFAQINFSAILVCAVLNMVLGFIWYGFLFSKAFIQLMGITPEHMSDPEAQRAAVHGYFASFFSSIIMAVVLSYMIIFTNSSSVVEGLN